MKNVVILILLISVAFVSCDGRQNKRESLQKAVSEFNQKYSKAEDITFYPKEYTEVVTDTTLSNTLKVHIKNYSLLDEHVLLSSSDQNPSKQITYHRVFESEILVSTSKKDILKMHISAEKFRTNDPFWNNATLQYAWVNEELSSADEANIDFSFLDPRTKAYKLYRMVVDVEGQQNIYLIEEHS